MPRSPRRSLGMTVRTRVSPNGWLATVTPIVRRPRLANVSTAIAGEPFGTRGGWIARSIDERRRAHDDGDRDEHEREQPEPDAGRTRASRSVRAQHQCRDTGQQRGQPCPASCRTLDARVRRPRRAAPGTDCRARAISSAPVRPCSSASGCRITRWASTTGPSALTSSGMTNGAADRRRRRHARRAAARGCRGARRRAAAPTSCGSRRRSRRCTARARARPRPA